MLSDSFAAKNDAERMEMSNAVGFPYLWTMVLWCAAVMTEANTYIPSIHSSNWNGILISNPSTGTNYSSVSQNEMAHEVSALMTYIIISESWHTRPSIVLAQPVAVMKHKLHNLPICFKTLGKGPLCEQLPNHEQICHILDAFIIFERKGCGNYCPRQVKFSDDELHTWLFQKIAYPSVDHSSWEQSVAQQFRWTSASSPEKTEGRHWPPQAVYLSSLYCSQHRRKKV